MYNKILRYLQTILLKINFFSISYSNPNNYCGCRKTEGLNTQREFTQRDLVIQRGARIKSGTIDSAVVYIILESRISIMLGGWLRDKAESLSRLGVSTMAPVGVAGWREGEGGSKNVA